MKEKEIFIELLKKLDGLNWFLIGGFFIEVITNGKRKSRDIDLVIHKNDIDEFARRLNVKARQRKLIKNGYVIEDYAIKTKFFGKDVEFGRDIEATCGYPKKRVLRKMFDKLFEKKTKKKYLGLSFFMAPLEEIIILKALFFRQKDVEDLMLLKRFKVNYRLLKELSDDQSVWKKVKTNLLKIGYKIK